MFVYADHAATAPIRKSALDAMLPWLTDGYGNAASIYKIARDAKRALEEARSDIAKAIGARTEEIFFTSGGTESDNWALKGTVGAAGRGRHVITTAVEHHAILHTVEFLGKSGCEITTLTVGKDGQINPGELAEAVRPDTAIVSVMMANNEIGTVLPVQKLFERVKEKNRKTLCHTDAVQAVGHIPVSVEGIDMLSLSGHKFGGPKGIGALYVRKGIKLDALLHGGGHERGKRSGTENVAGAVGMAAALREAVDNLDHSMKKVKMLRDRLVDGILKIPYSFYNGGKENRLPGNASFIFEGVEGESLVLGLDMKGICASSGSACSSGSLDPSHVLMAIGLPQEVAHGSLRLSLGEENTEEEVDYIVKSVTEVVSLRRSMSPLWNEKEQKPTERFW